MLVNQQPSLVSHIWKKYEHAGGALFEDKNAWVALVEIFNNVLQDPRLGKTCLIIDALDECVVDLPKLLHFIAQHSTSSHVKWIVSSRNWPDIEEHLERAGHKVRLSLELNAESVSTAVQIFIEQKVSRLAWQKKYDEQTQGAVLEYLISNAKDTFLWVALVCQNLETTAKRNTLKKMNMFPPGLDALYKKMMQQINNSDDSEICKQILALISIVYRPVSLWELPILVEQLEDIADNLESIEEIVSLCGSFLTISEGTIYFFHQSAQDFLRTIAVGVGFPNAGELHYTIFARSLIAMSRILHRDMYGLKELGYPIDDVKQPDSNPLASLRYSCVYWIDHLCASNPGSLVQHIDALQDGGVVDIFLREKYIYWLEALSLCKSMSKGVTSVAKLWFLIQVYCFWG